MYLLYFGVILDVVVVLVFFGEIWLLFIDLILGCGVGMVINDFFFIIFLICCFGFREGGVVILLEMIWYLEIVVDSLLVIWVVIDVVLLIWIVFFLKDLVLLVLFM